MQQSDKQQQNLVRLASKLWENPNKQSYRNLHDPVNDRDPLFAYLVDKMIQLITINIYNNTRSVFFCVSDENCTLIIYYRRYFRISDLYSYMLRSDNFLRRLISEGTCPCDNF